MWMPAPTPFFFLASPFPLNSYPETLKGKSILFVLFCFNGKETEKRDEVGKEEEVVEQIKAVPFLMLLGRSLVTQCFVLTLYLVLHFIVTLSYHKQLFLF